MSWLQTVQAWSGFISACATALNTILVCWLAVITGKYARTTAAILEESRKAREAAERQVAAAKSQASAAQAQASVAYQTLALLKQQLEDQLGLGRGIVQTAIHGAISAIDYWRSLKLIDLAKERGLPQTDGLIAPDMHGAIEHARRISEKGAELLAAAWDNLQRARDEIDRLKERGISQGHWLGHHGDLNFRGETYLKEAFDLLLRAQKSLLGAE